MQRWQPHLRHVTLVACCASLVASIGWSVAAAEPVRREIISPGPATDVGILAGAVIEPPPRWPPPGGIPVKKAVPPAPERKCTRAKKSKLHLEGKLNLNSATQRELELLPGIGSAKAKRILRWRRHRGRFRRVIDLRRVRGFGRKSVARLYPYLTVAQSTTLRQVSQSPAKPSQPAR